MGLMDKAAACMTAYAYEAACLPADHKERICRMVCCCDKYPIVRSYKLKQLCVDRLMAANNLHNDGILGGVPYDMETLLPAKGYPHASIAAQLKKYLDGAYYTNRIRIPDVTVLKDSAGPITPGNIDKLYEIKFPRDTDRNGQMNDYSKIAEVEELNVEKCNCDNRTDPESILVPEAIRQAAIDRANSSILHYIEQNETELFQALREAGMAKEAQSLGLSYLNATDPNFFFKVLEIAIPSRVGKIGGGLGKLPVPKPLPPSGPFPVPVP